MEDNLNFLQMEVNLKFVNSRELILLIEYLLNPTHLQREEKLNFVK